MVAQLKISLFQILSAQFKKKSDCEIKTGFIRRVNEE